jgi:hypothetical protein
MVLTLFGTLGSVAVVTRPALRNARRHALGLISLANYSCTIRAVYGMASPTK